jgi:TonB family protein
MSHEALAVILLALTFSPQHKVRSLVHVESFEYPPLAWAARIQGEVVAIAELGADGHVRRVGVTSGHPLLGKAAADNLDTWKFEPGDQEEIQVTYKFVLQEPKAHTPHTICKFDLPGTVTVISTLPVADH